MYIMRVKAENIISLSNLHTEKKYDKVLTVFDKQTIREIAKFIKLIQRFYYSSHTKYKFDYTCRP